MALCSVAVQNVLVNSMDESSDMVKARSKHVGETRSILSHTVAHLRRIGPQRNQELSGPMHPMSSQGLEGHPREGEL